MRWLPLPLLALLGCSTDDSGPPPPPIAVGIYGTTMSASDIGGQEDGIAPDVDVAVYAADDTLVTRMNSDPDDASFAFELPAGTYTVCAFGWDPSSLYDNRDWNCTGACTRLEVTDAPVRANWFASVGRSYWNAGDRCP